MFIKLYIVLQWLRPGEDVVRWCSTIIGCFWKTTASGRWISSDGQSVPIFSWSPVTLLLVPSYPPPSYSRANKKLSRRPPLTYGWLPFYLFLLFQKPWVCSTQTVQGTPCILLGLGIARPTTLCSLCSLLVMEGRNKLSGARLQSPKFSPSNLTSSRFLVNPVLLPRTLYLPPQTPGSQLEPCLSSVLDQILPITGSEWIRIPDAPSRGCQ